MDLDPKKIIFSDKGIELRHYTFRSSSIRHENLITLEDINEVNLNTFPPSIVINHKEVIFIDTNLRKKFIEFVKQHDLKVENRFDIWEAINEAFLDTEFTESHKKRTLENLAKNGIPPEEVAQIRQEITEIMGGWGSIAWEANYLGHYDLLLNKKQAYLLRFPKDFYWWTMEIALRNYKK